MQPMLSTRMSVGFSLYARRLPGRGSQRDPGPHLGLLRGDFHSEGDGTDMSSAGSPAAAASSDRAKARGIGPAVGRLVFRPRPRSPTRPSEEGCSEDEHEEDEPNFADPICVNLRNLWIRFVRRFTQAPRQPLSTTIFQPLGAKPWRRRPQLTLE